MLSLGSLGQFRRTRVRLRGTRPALAGKLGEGKAFALRAREVVDRFLCSLRSGPAAAGVARSSEPAADHRAILAYPAGHYDSKPAKITGMAKGFPLAAFPAVSESVTKGGVARQSEVPGLKIKDKIQRASPATSASSSTHQTFHALRPVSTRSLRIIRKQHQNSPLGWRATSSRSLPSSSYPNTYAAACEPPTCANASIAKSSDAPAERVYSPTNLASSASSSPSSWKPPISG